jgi:two-component system sensor histidine kinase QseC
VVLVAMALAVRQALQPVHAIASEIEHRRVDDLHPVRLERLPAELRPLVVSMNRLFARIGAAIEHERRLTADAAHELRTPLAALRAQWEAARLAQSDDVRMAAWRQIGTGIDRVGRLIEQLLALAAVESRPDGGFTELVRWQRVVEQAISDCMPLIEHTGCDVEVQWPEGERPLPLVGDEELLALLLRNLLDNAVRYSPPGSRVTIRVGADRLEVEDEGPGMAEAVSTRIGDRFYRPPGQAEPGSGLGVSIVMRVAALHRLEVAFANRSAGEPGADGLRVTLRPAPRGSPSRAGNA